MAGFLSSVLIVSILVCRAHLILCFTSPSRISCMPPRPSFRVYSSHFHLSLSSPSSLSIPLVLSLHLYPSSLSLIHTHFSPLPRLSLHPPVPLSLPRTHTGTEDNIRFAIDDPTRLLDYDTRQSIEAIFSVCGVVILDGAFGANVTDSLLKVKDHNMILT